MEPAAATLGEVRRLALMVLAAAALAAGCGSDDTSAPAPAPAPTSPPATPADAATGLQVPWGLAFLPDGRALVSERETGRILSIPPGGGEPQVEMTVPGVDPDAGEGGLLGIALSPDYSGDGLVYAYMTTADDNRIVRFRLGGEPEPILTGLARGRIHNGGRIAFGPDGRLYAGVGDTGDLSLPQDPESRSGKILRMDPDGSVPADNPAGSLVWSLGHRNVQGLAWDGVGRLWATEFGQNAVDEVNVIRPGANYGWPEVEGTGGGEGLTDPLVTWSTSEASPSGAAIAGDDLYVAALRGQRLWRVPLDGARAGAPVPTSGASSAGCAPSSSGPTGPSGSRPRTPTAAARRRTVTTASSGWVRRRADSTSGGQTRGSVSLRFTPPWSRSRADSPTSSSCRGMGPRGPRHLRPRFRGARRPFRTSSGSPLRASRRSGAPGAGGALRRRGPRRRRAGRSGRNRRGDPPRPRRGSPPRLRLAPPPSSRFRPSWRAPAPPRRRSRSRSPPRRSAPRALARGAARRGRGGGASEGRPPRSSA